jgi:hypothetical protein
MQATRRRARAYRSCQQLGIEAAESDLLRRLLAPVSGEVLKHEAVGVGYDLGEGIDCCWLEESWNSQSLVG